MSSNAPGHRCASPWAWGSGHRTSQIQASGRNPRVFAFCYFLCLCVCVLHVACLLLPHPYTGLKNGRVGERWLSCSTCMCLACTKNWVPSQCSGKWTCQHMPGNPNTGEMGAGEPIVNSKSSSTTQQTLCLPRVQETLPQNKNKTLKPTVATVCRLTIFVCCGTVRTSF